VGQSNDYPDGKYVKCIVLGPSKTRGTVELSMRDTRIDKEVGVDNNDSIPKPNDMVHAYVVSTTKMGCFVRLSRSVEGRVILKELSDEFIPNPSAVFPPGRLVVGKVKSVKEPSSKKGGRPADTMVDMDMRESVLLSSADRISLDDVKVNSKYTGVITRVESYGVFVRIDNSDVSGLAHVSECSDSYIKNIFDLYNPGDFVKLVVIQMDKEQSRLAFSLKASNFDDSDDDSSSSSSRSDDEESDAMEVESDGEGDDDTIDSDDENFAAKLAKKMEVDGDDEEDKMEVDNEDEDSDDDSSTVSSSESESSGSEDDDEEENPKVKAKSKSSSSAMAMDTNVGFDWGSTAKPTKSTKSADSSDDSDDSSSSSEEESDNEDADADIKSSHKSRKKAAAKRREEEETSRRESALADGTADETPETSADFERLVASSPNSSEVWIKYMAFHLSLADMDSARKVANRAFERIEFRQEGEKVSVPSFHVYLVCPLHRAPQSHPLNSYFNELFSSMSGQLCLHWSSSMELIRR
jgi:rRNA biogenesis protein RRP5